MCSKINVMKHMKASKWKILVPIWSLILSLVTLFSWFSINLPGLFTILTLIWWWSCSIAHQAFACAVFFTTPPSIIHLYVSQCTSYLQFGCQNIWQIIISCNGNPEFLGNLWPSQYLWWLNVYFLQIGIAIISRQTHQIELYLWMSKFQRLHQTNFNVKPFINI